MFMKRAPVGKEIRSFFSPMYVAKAISSTERHVSHRKRMERRKKQRTSGSSKTGWAGREHRPRWVPVISCQCVLNVYYSLVVLK